MILCSECGSPSTLIHTSPGYAALSGPGPAGVSSARIRYEPCGHDVLIVDTADDADAALVEAAQSQLADDLDRVAECGLPGLNHLVPDGMRIVRWGAGFVRGGADREADRLDAVASAYEDEAGVPDLLVWMTPEETAAAGVSRPPAGTVECLVRVSWA